MQRKLHEVEPYLGTIDEMLITLGCGHVFTVETLDGVCELSEFYDKDSQEQWVATRLPSSESGFRNPPSCPTCRGPVTARRYGRAVKRANLDIVERNVASSMSRRLDELTTDVEKLDNERARASIETELTKLQSQQAFKDETLSENASTSMNDKAMRSWELHREDAPPQLAANMGQNMHKIFKLSSKERAAWINIATPLIKLYTRAIEIAATRFAHTAAWEASFATLYRDEVSSDAAATQPRPQQWALARTIVRMAQPRPSADIRFATEALWMSIELRLKLVALGRHWLKSVTDDHKNRAKIWAAYCSYILMTALKDATAALAGCRRAKNHRQTLLSLPYILRVQFELASLELFMLRPTGLSSEARAQEMVSSCSPRRLSRV
jgi:hypothetical protein